MNWSPCARRQRHRSHGGVEGIKNAIPGLYHALAPSAPTLAARVEPATLPSSPAFFTTAIATATADVAEIPHAVPRQRELVQERRLSDVRVAHERYRGLQPPVARAPLEAPPPLDVLQLAVDLRGAVAQQTAPRLQGLLAGPPYSPESSPLPVEAAVAAFVGTAGLDEVGGLVLEPCQLYLRRREGGRAAEVGEYAGRGSGFSGRWWWGGGRGTGGGGSEGEGERWWFDHHVALGFPTCDGSLRPFTSRFCGNLRFTNKFSPVSLRWASATPCAWWCGVPSKRFKSSIYCCQGFGPNGARG